MLEETEVAQLTRLLSKLDDGFIPQPVFHALMRKIVSVPIELCVFDATGRILMFRREADDPEFAPQWHMPGTVIRSGESVDEAVARLLRNEVCAPVLWPASLGWFECLRDAASPRHAIALLHATRLDGPYTGSGSWFDPMNLPADTLAHHKKMIPVILERATRR